MKLGVMNPVLYHKSFEEALCYLNKLGVQTVEIGAGGYPGDTHLNPKEVWNDIISALKTIGYDGAISIEHEDALMSPEEGLEKAIAFLKDTLIFENAGDM